MADVTIRNWQATRIANFAARAMQPRVNAAAAEVAAEIRGVISKQGPPRSTAGRPPHIDSGELIRSVGWRPTGRPGEAVVEIKSRYALILEFGTRFLAPRPFIRRSLLAIMAVRRLFSSVTLRR